MHLKTVFSFLWNTKYLTYQMVYSSLNAWLIATFPLSLDFVMDVFMTLETLVKFKGWYFEVWSILLVRALKDRTRCQYFRGWDGISFCGTKTTVF